MSGDFPVLPPRFKSVERPEVAVVSLCVGLVRLRDRVWEARVAEVPDDHDHDCRGQHGDPVGLLAAVGRGECERCGGQVRRLFMRVEGDPTWDLCRECVCEWAMAEWLLGAAWQGGREK